MTRRPTKADLKVLWAVKEIGTPATRMTTSAHFRELKQAGLIEEAKFGDVFLPHGVRLSKAGEWLIANNRAYSGVQA